MPRPVCLPMYPDDDLGGLGEEVFLTGWGLKFVESECAFAWYDKEERRWIHKPPRVKGEETTVNKWQERLDT